LATIDGFAGLLLRDFQAELPAEALQYARLIHASALEMQKLVTSLLDFSRSSRQPLKRQTVQPAELARASLDELLSQQTGREVEIVLGSLPECQADPILLKQVFANLLSNALKFTRERPVARIEIGACLQDNQTAYFVRDNGVGFDMEQADKLFGVFQRLHDAEDFEGNGVGLAIVARIVHRHDGRVWAEAQVDQGATFFFVLGND
jgi:light-regulated signal transduction histidine kinase (bacteriophytochrome)